MQSKVKVAVDAMGGDHSPGEIVKGAVDAVNERGEVEVFLAGRKEAVEQELSRYHYR